MIDRNKVEQAVRLLLEGMGEDPSREGLIDTPERVARMYEELYSGMDEHPGMYLEKTFRAENNDLIVEKDLKEALESGKVAGAAVDVVSEEPVREDNPLMTAPNMIITPHIAWASRESRKRLMDIAVDNLKSFLQGRPQNVVSVLRQETV